MQSQRLPLEYPSHVGLIGGFGLAQESRSETEGRLYQLYYNDEQRRRDRFAQVLSLTLSFLGAGLSCVKSRLAFVACQAVHASASTLSRCS